MTLFEPGIQTVFVWPNRTYKSPLYWSPAVVLRPAVYIDERRVSVRAILIRDGQVRDNSQLGPYWRLAYAVSLLTLDKNVLHYIFYRLPAFNYTRAGRTVLSICTDQEPGARALATWELVPLYSRLMWLGSRDM